MSPPFVPGVELSGLLYREAVQPLLSHHFPGLAYTAALIGPGSEVLGFDTERSTDHNWGPRLQLFLRKDDHAAHGSRLDDVLAEALPPTVAGYPIGLATVDNPGTRHGVVVTELGDWLTGQLGFDPGVRITTGDWLATPTQALAELTAGVVHHDGLGRLHRVRDALAWYPDDLWRYVLACQWRRISQEEAFVGRCGEVGDELGSAIVAARLVRDLMRLCLLINRTYPPYSKWLGSAFRRLPCADELGPVLAAAVGATSWPERERHLTAAYPTVAGLHNGLGLTEPVDARVRPFHDRPFQVLDAERFATALVGGITDRAVRELPPTGAVDQFVDNTDVLEWVERTSAVSNALYGSG